MMKPFDMSVLCGRLQHMHIGHEHLINTGLKLSDRILILVGSSQEIGTERNPFDIQTRIEMIREVYPQDNVIIKPLPDLTVDDDITPEWGRYVLDNITRYVRKKPEILIYGNDEARSKWFDPKDIASITEVIISRARIDISATKMRKFLLDDNFEEWVKYSNPRLHKFYDRLQRELRSADYLKSSLFKE